MNTRQQVGKAFLLCAVAMAAALVCVSCFSPWTGEEVDGDSGGVEVRIHAAPLGRYVVGDDPFGSNISKIKHEVALIEVEPLDGGGWVDVNRYSHTIPAGESSATIHVDPGFYRVEVQGTWYMKVYSRYPSPSAPAQTPIEVKAGQITRVGTVTMVKDSGWPNSGYITIENAEELAKIGVDANYPPDGHYLLVDDIDFDDYPRTSWTPIGTPLSPFEGSFDGNGCSIYNLFIDNPTGDHIGLFGYILNGKVSNLFLENVDITGNNTVGGIAAYNQSGEIANCSIYGRIEGNANVGGIAGFSQASITHCESDVMVKSARSAMAYAGGIVGYHAGLTIQYCSAYGSVEGIYAGGIVGFNQGTVKDCYAEVQVTGIADAVLAPTFAGGVVGGNNTGAIVENCYALGSVALAPDVYFDSRIGGVVGDNFIGRTEKCVALNENLQMPAAITNFGRVTGFNGPTATIADNYGKSDMAKDGDATYDWGATRNMNTLTNLDGADVSEDGGDGPDGAPGYLDAAWWTDTLAWPSDDPYWIYNTVPPTLEVTILRALP